MNVTLDLDSIISALKQRWGDLQNVLNTFQDPNPAEYFRRRSQLLQRMSDIDEEIIKQSRIRNDNNAAQVVVSGVTPEKAAELNAALSDLNQAIQQTEVWGRVIALTTAALTASATLRKAI